MTLESATSTVLDRVAAVPAGAFCTASCERDRARHQLVADQKRLKLVELAPAAPPELAACATSGGMTISPIEHDDADDHEVDGEDREPARHTPAAGRYGRSIRRTSGEKPIAISALT